MEFVVFGGRAAGLFDSAGFSWSVMGVQAIGILAAFVWTFPVSYLIFKGIDALIPLRVNGHLEEMGLDLHEHDAEAYPEFTPDNSVAPA